MAGRKPKPTALHQLHGTFNVTDHRARGSEPVPDIEITDEPPDHFTERQADLWRWCLANAPVSVVKNIDRQALASYVVACDTMRTVEIEHQAASAAALERKEPTSIVRNAAGSWVPHPLFTVWNHAALVALRCAAEMGFTPASRPKLAMAKGAGLDVPEGKTKGGKAIVSPWDGLDLPAN